jgi:hypothetical protein
MFGREVTNQRILGEELSIYEKDYQLTSNALVLKNNLIHLSAIKNMDRMYAR